MANGNASTSDEIDQAMNPIQQPNVPKNPRSRKSGMNTQRENTGRHAGVQNDRASETVTIVLERCKPLILKLRNPKHSYLGLGSAVMPEKEVEQMVDELGNELVGYLTETLNSLRNEVKQARPQEGEENYQMKMAAYLELLSYITNVIKTLTDVLSHSLAEFRQLIEQLWKDIQQSQDENQVQQHVQEFLHKTEQTFQDAVSKKIEPLFAAIEGKINIPNGPK